MSARARPLEETIRLLSDPSAYDPPPAAVRVEQTHGACVFLTGAFAYKMKKPVRYAFFDFSTLEKRRVALEREFWLNRRMSPEVYLDVLPVVEEGGRLRVPTRSEEGEAVEYLLRMRELPRERFLSAVLARGEGRPELLARVAKKIAAFHMEADRGPEIAAFGAPDALRRMFLDNLEECLRLPEAHRPGAGALADCRAAFGRILAQFGPVFRARAEGGFVRDVHGDLRMEHIVLVEEDVVVFDCLDFRDDFRCLDTAHEMASLLVEMRQGGFAEEARAILLAYLEETGDAAALPLLPAYLLHRALVRGKVEALKAAAAALAAEERDEAASLSRAHFETAAEIAARERRPRLIVVGGLMAAGKTALARGLGEATGAAVHHSDPVRKELAGLAPTAARPEPWERGLYAPEVTERVYAELRERAGRDLAAGRDAVVDASFSRRAEREAFARLARERGARFDPVECVSPGGERRARLGRRAARRRSVSDGRVEIMEAQERGFEPWEGARFAIDTTGPKAASLAKALRALYLDGGAGQVC